MGEKVAFYFAFCGFYNKMLILPSIVGVIVFIYGVSSVATDVPTYVPCVLIVQQDNVR
jgi:anoctamin-7